MLTNTITVVRQVKILFAACFRFLNLLSVTLDKFRVKLQCASNHLVILRSNSLSHILRFSFYFFFLFYRPTLYFEINFAERAFPTIRQVLHYFHCFFCYLHKVDSAPKLTCFLFAVMRKLILNLVDFVWKKMLVTLGLYVQPFLSVGLLKCLNYRRCFSRMPFLLMEYFTEDLGFAGTGLPLSFTTTLRQSLTV